ncbi:hypothetical protein [Ammoniphilus resinae]|uniref:Transglutaminase-like cysteine proteinase n=1 Tax=Ammoniphilus resinae TaxID=861532 RepID=A0ABS4GN29_9BACL|nr:hypothetical protein [Ammoniphilus resinae]MBP1931680.1 putative transglutaminase-like cysteine proteinase [Ammoniphilus resinae]
MIVAGISFSVFFLAQVEAWRETIHSILMVKFASTPRFYLDKISK